MKHPIISRIVNLEAHVDARLFDTPAVPWWQRAAKAATPRTLAGGAGMAAAGMLGAAAATPRDEERVPVWKTALRAGAGALGGLALAGGGIAANRFVQRRYGSQGLGSWGAAKDEALLRLRQGWMNHRSRLGLSARLQATEFARDIHPRVAYAKRQEEILERFAKEQQAARDQLNAKTRRGRGMLIGALAGAPLGWAAGKKLGGQGADAAIMGLYGTMAGSMVGGGIGSLVRRNPKRDWRLSRMVQAIVEFDARPRNGDGQFVQGAGEQVTPEMAAAAYAGQPRHDAFSKMIEANRRKRRLKQAGLILGGAGAGAALTAGTLATLKARGVQVPGIS